MTKDERTGELVPLDRTHRPTVADDLTTDIHWLDADTNGADCDAFTSDDSLTRDAGEVTCQACLDCRVDDPDFLRQRLAAVEGRLGRPNVADDPTTEFVLEWGVRFPSGSVDPQPDEATARHFALAFNHSRPDLPTLVVRKVVTDWEVPPPEQTDLKEAAHG